MSTDRGVPTRDECQARDASDPLAGYRDEFVIADERLIYFDGNSLGRLPKRTVERVQQVLTDEWGEQLIRSWRQTWMDLPATIGDQIGVGLLGAQPGETVVGDNTTVNLYKAISAALDARPGRRDIVIERDNFPTDRYIVESLASQRGLNVRWVEETGDGLTVDTLARHLDRDVAVVVLSSVDYRSAAITEMAPLTAAVHEVGALTLWDVCHAVGSIPLDLAASDADLAVGCTYKYLNGGPGAPAFTFVRSDLSDSVRQPIWGWWGRADMFDMPQGYQPFADIRSWLTGTPGVLSMVGVEAGVEMTVRAGMEGIREKSIGLTTLAIDLFDDWLAPRGMGLASPRDPSRRGSHVTLTHSDSATLVDLMTHQGVLPDFRRPDGIRIGLAPLTTRYVDVYDGLAILRDLLGR